MDLNNLVPTVDHSHIISYQRFTTAPLHDKNYRMGALHGL